MSLAYEHNSGFIAERSIIYEPQQAALSNLDWDKPLPGVSSSKFNSEGRSVVVFWPFANIFKKAK